MSPGLRRFGITLVVVLLAGGVVATMVLGPRRPAPTPAPQTPVSGPAQDPPETVTPAQVPADRAASPPAPETSPTAAEPDPVASSAPADPTPPATLVGLRAVAPTSDAGLDLTPAPLGSLDALKHRMEVTFSRRGAGIARIAFSDIWETAAARRQAAAHFAALRDGYSLVPPLPDERWRYVLATEQPYRWVEPKTGKWESFTVPVLAIHRVEVEGQRVPLLSAEAWSATGPGAFATRIEDGEGRGVLEITRRFILDEYHITIEQAVANLTDRPLSVRLVQYGPTELRVDRGAYIERRRLRIAYWPLPQLHPDIIVTDDNDFLWEHGDLIKRSNKVQETLDPLRQAELRQELLTFWPPADPEQAGWRLAWFTSTNRYFALVVHPLDTTPGALEQTVATIRAEVPGGADKDKRISFTLLSSPLRTIEPGAQTSFDLGVFAGPQRRDLLSEGEPYTSLRMRGLILYQMSSFCAICTFQWLAHGLLWFLSAVEAVLGDWGLAIIILVLSVRTLLHPITKKAQIKMQRFGKVMSDLKPELEKLQKKYANEPRKLQAEQMKMMKERGANPLQMLGCLPMFLQMPIWVALYAMLYFAFDLRQEPAFWGFFQLFADWPFLADLSAADHCLWEFEEPFRFLMWNVTGINVLPALMGLVFFFQQKYMAPPPSPTMTKEQLQQQKIMKVMMVVMFPVMLYSAPSGLTLYIFTSSLFGIIEGRYIRAHIKELELAPPKPRVKKKRPRDPQARAFADAIQRAKQKRQSPPKSYKKRR